MFALDASVQGAEAVNHRFELRGHAVVIQRGGKHQHVGPKDCRANAFHVVLLHAWAVIAACDATAAGLEAGMRHVDQLNFMPAFLRATPKCIRQQVRGAPLVGAAHQHCNVHTSTSYCASLTGSSHSLRPFTPGTSTARWLIQLSFAAPCQCLTPAGILITLPGVSSCAGLPHS